MFGICKCLGRVKVNACQYPPSPWFGGAEQNVYGGGGVETLKLNTVKLLE